ncbi:MAG TPA: Sua5/YciO/YrdC/YwlC family protein, partial [Fusobacterium ulcerans]|nr:Sua5/YciO/YrdC/YwlC family protein [Fusobacterium ulcerans]
MNKVKYTSLNANYDEIGRLLKDGNLIIYPTDTVYGVGGIIESDEAITKVYKAK